MTPRLDRRAVLLGTAGVALTACSGPGEGSAAARRTPGAAAPTTAATTAPTAGGSGSTTAGRPPWSRLARTTRGDLLLPHDRDYAQARLLQNPRFDDQRPLALLRVSGPDDVATAIAFAQDHDVPIALRSGGHCYAGWSGGGSPPALVLDCRGLDDVDVRGEAAVVGPGAPLVDVYRGLAGSGRAIGAGSCPTVGFGGLTLGGGVGVLVRSFGLTCDAVTSMQVVTADGRTLTASADDEPDLFFALRGGGGGHVGVVTSFTVTTRAAPDLSTAYLQWPLSAAADVVPAWFDWAPAADARLWSTCKALGGSTHADGPVVLVSASWTGPDSGFDRQLAGLLDHVPAPAVDSRHRRGYLDAMLSYAGCLDLSAAACTTGPGGALPRAPFAATSHVAYDSLGGSGVDDLVTRVEAAQGSRLTEAGLSIDALGGAVRDVDADATAFVHRAALATVQYTATYDAAHTDGAPRDATRAADAYVHRFRDTMTPHWGDHAYVNYADATLGDPDAAYFGDNAARLADVRAAYDPHGFFTQPQDW